MAQDICILSRTEYDQLKDYGIRPNCRKHRHCKEKTVDEFISSGYWFSVTGLGKPKIAPVDGRTWHIVQARRGRIYGGPNTPQSQYQ